MTRVAALVAVFALVWLPAAALLATPSSCCGSSHHACCRRTSKPGAPGWRSGISCSDSCGEVPGVMPAAFVLPSRAPAQRPERVETRAEAPRVIFIENRWPAERYQRPPPAVI